MAASCALPAHGDPAPPQSLSYKHSHRPPDSTEGFISTARKSGRPTALRDSHGCYRPQLSQGPYRVGPIGAISQLRRWRVKEMQCRRVGFRGWWTQGSPGLWASDQACPLLQLGPRAPAHTRPHRCKLGLLKRLPIVPRVGADVTRWDSRTGFLTSSL